MTSGGTGKRPGGGAESERVALGAIVRAHALTGEVGVKPFNPDSSLLGELDKVFVDDGKGGVTTMRIARARRSPKEWLVHFEGVDDRDAAEALRGREVSVLREAFPELGEDEVYLADLIGLEVREGEKLLGKVTAYFEYPSVDCLRVSSDEGDFELPMLPTFLVGVDEERGVVEAQHTVELPRERPKRP